MAAVVKIKRSSVQGKAPTISDIQSGELALNTKDGKLFSSDGTTVFEIGANLHSLSVGTGGFSIANGTLTFPTTDGSNTQVLTTDGAGNLYWSTSTGQAYATFKQYSFIASNNQTTFSGFDKFGTPVGYTPNYISVYLNGVKLLANTDYTAEDGSSIVLTSNTAAEDVLSIQSFGAVANFVDVNASLLGNTATSNAATQIVADSFLKTGYRSVKYMVQGQAQQDNNLYQVSEVLLIHNGSATFTTEYGTVATSNTFLTIDSDISGDNVRLLVTPSVANTKITVTRLGIMV